MGVVGRRVDGGRDGRVGITRVVAAVAAQGLYVCGLLLAVPLPAVRV